MKRYTIQLLTLLVLVGTAAGVFHCSVNDLSGGGSDVGNGMVVGRIVSSDGKPAPNTSVSLIPINYNPQADKTISDSLIDTTNSLGEYVFGMLKKGLYNIQAVQLINRTRSLRNINVAGDTVSGLIDTLRQPGAVKVMLPDSVDVVNGYVYIPGTTIATVLIGSSGFIVLDSVPAGTISAVYYSTTGGSVSTVIRYDVLVASGDTVTIENPEWKYARALYLNTTPSGADVAGNSISFPVLIRLTVNNFNFSQTKINGDDIRFSKPDNTPLAYEIERWDASQARAEVWVNVDTIYGNNSGQYLIMYWGNPNASGSSNSAAVFDTSNYFRGVWHLGESSGNVGDATYNNCAGTRNGNQARTAGDIGYGQTYSDSGDYSEMGNVLNPGASNLTVSAWVKRSDTSSIQTIIAKSNGGLPSSTYGWLMTFDTNNHVEGFIASGGTIWGSTGTFAYSSSSTVTDLTIWHYVTVVFDRSGNSNCRIYIDGSDVTSNRTGDVTGVGSLTNAVNLRIGSEADGGYHLNGSVDECVVSNTARSPDWIKLCYMNQKANDALIVYK